MAQTGFSHSDAPQKPGSKLGETDGKANVGLDTRSAVFSSFSSPPPKATTPQPKLLSLCSKCKHAQGLHHYCYHPDRRAKSRIVRLWRCKFFEALIAFKVPQRKRKYQTTEARP